MPTEATGRPASLRKTTKEWRNGSRRRVGAAVAVALALVSVAGFAEDYSVFGTAEASVNAHIGRPLILSGLARLRLNHRLTYPAVEGVLTHSITAVPGGALGHGISEAYLTLYAGSAVTIRAGRQRVNWGAGYLLSPTDSLHAAGASPVGALLGGETASGDDSGSAPADDASAAGSAAAWEVSPESFFGSRSGMLGAATILTLGANATVTAAVAADEAILGVGGASSAGNPPTTEAWKLLRYAATTSAFLSPVDLSISMVYAFQRTFRPGLAVSASVPGLVVYAEGAVELHNGALYPRASSDAPTGIAFDRPNLWDPFPLLAAGFEVPLSAGGASGSITMEYLYSSTGYNEEEARLLLNAAMTGAVGVDAISAPLPRYFRRHYLVGTANIDYRGYAGIEMAGVFGLEAAGAALSGKATLLFVEGTDLWLGAIGFLGGEDSEFGAYPPTDGLPRRLIMSIGSTLHF